MISNIIVKSEEIWDDLFLDFDEEDIYTIKNIMSSPSFKENYPRSFLSDDSSHSTPNSDFKGSTTSASTSPNHSSAFDQSHTTDPRSFLSDDSFNSTPNKGSIYSTSTSPEHLMTIDQPKTNHSSYLTTLDDLARLNHTNNPKYLQILLKYPQITPARLDMILKYKSTDFQPPTRKRVRRPYTREEKDKRNYRRRFFYRCRSVLQDFPQTFALMSTNVLNSGDIILFNSFLQQYFQPNFLYTKSLKTSDLYTKKYCTYTREDFFRVVDITFKSTPDIMYIVERSEIKYNPITKQSVIICKMNVTSTRMMMFSSLIQSFLSKLQSLTMSMLTSSNTTKILEEEILIPHIKSEHLHIGMEENINPWIDYKKQDDIEDEEVKFLHDALGIDTIHSNEVLNPFTNPNSPMRTKVIWMISDLFNHINVYSVIQQILSQPSNVLISLLPWFPSGIRIECDYEHHIYVNENLQATQLDLFIETVKIGLSTK